MRVPILLLIPVALLTAQTTVRVSPSSIVKTFASDGTAATVGVTITGAPTATVTSITKSGGNWLSTTQETPPGSSPRIVNLTMDPAGLPDGTYFGTMNVVAAGATVGAVDIAIQVGNPGPVITAAGVGNAASYQSGAVSPGEILTIFGAGIGPAVNFDTQVVNGSFTTKLAGTRVWFDDTPAPLVFAYANQLAAIVPSNVALKQTVQVQVENFVARSVPVTLTVTDATPGLFTADASGQGLVAALNQDGTVNSTANPAARGSVVVLFATGAGPMTPALTDGSIVPATPPFPKPMLPVRVMIGGQDATLEYAGAAPTLVYGALQVNAVIPAGIQPGAAPVVLIVGTQSSPSGTTIAVR